MKPSHGHDVYLVPSNGWQIVLVGIGKKRRQPRDRVYGVVFVREGIFTIAAPVHDQHTDVSVAQLETNRVHLELLVCIVGVWPKLKPKIVDPIRLEQQPILVLDEAELIVMWQVESNVQLVELNHVRTVGSQVHEQFAILIRIVNPRTEAYFTFN